MDPRFVGESVHVDVDEGIALHLVLLQLTTR